MASVTIVVPNRNEPRCQATVQDLAAVLGDLAVVHVEDDPLSTGVGATIRRGLAHVETEFVLFAMADGSEDPLALRMMISTALLIEPSAVFGTRWSHGGTVVGYPVLKRIGNRLGNRLIRAMTGYPYDDWTDLSKLYRAAVLRQITWDDDFRCEVQIPLRYMDLFDRSEWFAPVLPMRWVERSVGRSSYRWRHAWGSLYALWREWRQSLG